MPLRRLLQSDLAATNSRCQRRIVPCVAMALGFSGALTDIDPPHVVPGLGNEGGGLETEC